MNLLGLANADYGVLAVYLVVMVLVGMFFSRRQNSSSEFFLAGRSMGWFPIGISVMATLLSALSYSGVPGESYYVGFHYFLLPAMVWLCIPDAQGGPAPVPQPADVLGLRVPRTAV